MSNWIFNGGVVPQLTTGNGGIAPPPPQSPFVAVAAAAQKMTFTPAPSGVSLVGQNKIVDPVTTQQAIYSQFRIINPVVKLP